MKRFISALTIVLTLMSSSFCFASEKLDTSAIDSKYNLKTLSENEIPSGITPIEFSSEEDLLEFLEEQEKVSNIDFGVINIEKNNVNSIERSRGSNTSSFNWSTSENHGYLKQYLSARIETYRNGSFGQINSVNSIHTYAEGYNQGVTYTPDPYSCGSEISSDKQSVYIYGSGDIERYLMIEGVFKLYTKRAKLSGTYRIY